MSTFRFGLIVLLWLASLPLCGQDTEPSGKPSIQSPVVAAPSQPRTDQPAGASENTSKSEAQVVAAPQVRPAATPVPVVVGGEGAAKRVRTVCRLSSVPANDAAATLNQLLAAEGQAAPGTTAASVVIVPDPISNGLVIGGPEEAVEQVRQLLQQIDCPALMVRLEVVLADVPVEQFDPGTLPKDAEILCRAQLTTLDKQPASLQVGRREPVVTGVSFSPCGQTNAVNYESVGTRIAITPRADANGSVALEVDIEDSRLSPSEQSEVLFVPGASGGSQKLPVGASRFSAGVAPAGPPSPAGRTPRTETLTTQSSVRIPAGQTVVLAAMSRQPDGKQRVILVTPHVLRLDAKK